MTDIVERLRGYHKDSAHGALHEAAYEIERLRKGSSWHYARTEVENELRHIRAATIEECAGAVENIVGPFSREIIIAAIRALKEKS